MVPATLQTQTTAETAAKYQIDDYISSYLQKRDMSSKVQEGKINESRWSHSPEKVRENKGNRTENTKKNPFSTWALMLAIC